MADLSYNTSAPENLNYLFSNVGKRVIKFEKLKILHADKTGFCRLFTYRLILEQCSKA